MGGPWSRQRNPARRPDRGPGRLLLVGGGLLGRRGPPEKPRLLELVGRIGRKLRSRVFAPQRERAARRATGTTGTTGASGAGGFGFGSTAAATGTISVVDGKTLYVLTTTGALVKVTLGPSTSITRNAKSTPIDLRPGDTVVVQGATATNGNVSASSVSATAPGVSSAGAFGGGGRLGGAGSGATTSG